MNKQLLKSKLINPFKVVLVGAISPLLLTACLSEGDGNSNEEDFSVLLSAITGNVIIPTYRSFDAVTDNWIQTTNVIGSYCAAIGGENEVSTLSQAQISWRDAMASWQQLEAFQIGPITDNGATLRNQIYSWPDSVSACTIDRNVVDAEAATPNMGNLPPQARGLDALEYLLFNDTLVHACPPQVEQTQNWNVRTEQERKQARCNYAQHIAVDISSSAKQLLTAWTDGDDNYKQALLASGGEGGALASQRDALKAISDSLFYLDDDMRDTKLGIPAGLSNLCDTFSCPEERESPYSDNGLLNIKNNLIGFRAAFTGSPDPLSTAYSFDDLLDERGFAEISQDILTQVDLAISRIDAQSESFNNLLNLVNNTETETQCTNVAANPDTQSDLFPCQLHGVIKRVTDELKGDFVTVINLSVPKRVEGDSD